MHGACPRDVAVRRYCLDAGGRGDLGRGRPARGGSRDRGAPGGEHRARPARQARRDQARHRRARLPRPRALRRRAGHRQDRARARDRPLDRGLGVRPRPVHAGPPALGRDRREHLRPEAPRLRVPPGAALRQRRPRRRDQPRDAEDTVGAARGDGRAAGDDRRADLRAPAAVPRSRDGEPDRVRRRVPASRGPARPVLPEGAARLPRRGRGARRRSSTSRRGTRSTGSSRWSGSPTSHSSRRRFRPSTSTTWSAAGRSSLVRSTRELPEISIGASVRGSLALERASRAWALLDGRSYTTPEDVERMFAPGPRPPPHVLADVHRRVARPVEGGDPGRGLPSLHGAGPAARARREMEHARTSLPARSPLAAGRLGLRAAAGGAPRDSGRASPPHGRTGLATTRA